MLLCCCKCSYTFDFFVMSLYQAYCLVQVIFSHQVQTYFPIQKKRILLQSEGFFSFPFLICRIFTFLKYNKRKNTAAFHRKIDTIYSFLLNIVHFSQISPSMFILVYLFFIFVIQRYSFLEVSRIVLGDHYPPSHFMLLKKSKKGLFYLTLFQVRLGYKCLAGLELSGGTRNRRRKQNSPPYFFFRNKGEEACSRPAIYLKALFIFYRYMDFFQFGAMDGGLPVLGSSQPQASQAQPLSGLDSLL